MSATLTWFNSGIYGSKSGTTIGACFTDLAALINATDAGADFTWELASSNVGSTPYYVVLKPKGGGAGRILIVSWSSGPAGNHAVLLGGAPTTSVVYVSYFPAGNTDTPSNLTAASGTILGDDTNALKVAPSNAISSLYAASMVPFYFDCAEGCVFGFQNPASSSVYWFAAGNLLVDAADTAYPCVIGGNTNAGSSISSSTAGLMPWTTSTYLGGALTPAVVCNYGSANRVYFQAWHPSAGWASVAPSATDILSNTGVNKRYFAPVHLLGQTKGEGIVLKLRQLAYGPGTTAAFESYSTTGPVVKARQLYAGTTGANGHLWATNFKL